MSKGMQSKRRAADFKKIVVEAPVSKPVANPIAHKLPVHRVRHAEHTVPALHQGHVSKRPHEVPDGRKRSEWNRNLPLGVRFFQLLAAFQAPRG